MIEIGATLVASLVCSGALALGFLYLLGNGHWTNGWLGAAWPLSHLVLGPAAWAAHTGPRRTSSWAWCLRLFPLQLAFTCLVLALALLARGPTDTLIPLLCLVFVEPGVAVLVIRLLVPPGPAPLPAELVAAVAASPGDRALARSISRGVLERAERGDPDAMRAIARGLETGLPRRRHLAPAWYRRAAEAEAARAKDAASSGSWRGS